MSPQQSSKENDVDTLFHVLGIVYYTVALSRLIAEIRKEQREKQSD